MLRIFTFIGAKMKLFNCTLRLGGLLTHSIPKERITEKEVFLLKAIHGGDAIVNLKQIGEITTSDSAEYRRLARFYSQSVVEKSFEIKLDGFQDWLAEQLENGGSEDGAEIEDEQPELTVEQQSPANANGASNISIE